MPRLTMVVVSMVVGLFIGNVLGAAILTLGLVEIVGSRGGTASGRRTTLDDNVLHVVVVARGRHSAEQLACARQHFSWHVSHAFPRAFG